MNKVSIILFLLVSVSFANTAVKPIDNADIKCGTFESEIKLNQFLSRILSPVDTIKGRPILSFNFESPSKHFLIHYDTTGYHKVSDVDINANSVPDYVELVAFYADSVYKIQIEQIGYRKPPIDSGLGGSDAYDIYLMNIGDDEFDRVFYGVTRRDFQIPGSSRFPVFASHIIMDNDYGPLDSNGTGEYRRQTFSIFGEPLVKITLAHEFHHSIQFGYGEDDGMSNSRILNEMTSTWMEYRCFPEVKDYTQYVRSLLSAPDKFPFGAGDARNGYYWCVFGQYLFDKHDDKALLRTWELVGNGLNSYIALDSALKECGSNLENSWCDFSSWLYYTGSRAIEGKYFPDAAIFPEINPKTKLNFTSPAIITTGTTQAFEQRCIRIFLPPQGETSLDTLDIIVANTDLYAAEKLIPSNKNFSITVANSPANHCKEIENSGFYYGLTAPNGNICEKAFFIISNPVDFAFPNPFNDNKFEYLNFPVPSGASLNSEVIVRIYNSDMTELFSEKLKVEIFQDLFDDKYSKRIAKIHATKFHSFQNGIYIYSVEFGENITFGKFTLLR